MLPDNVVLILPSSLNQYLGPFATVFPHDETPLLDLKTASAAQLERVGFSKTHIEAIVSKQPVFKDGWPEEFKHKKFSKEALSKCLFDCSKTRSFSVEK